MTRWASDSLEFKRLDYHILSSLGVVSLHFTTAMNYNVWVARLHAPASVNESPFLCVFCPDIGAALVLSKGEGSVGRPGFHGS